MRIRDKQKNREEMRKLQGDFKNLWKIATVIQQSTSELKSAWLRKGSQPASTVEGMWGRTEAKGTQRNETLSGLIGVVAFGMESQSQVF